MKAMLFAAGLGSRLRPITDSIPKPLIKIGGVTLLEFAIRKLHKSGFDYIVINVHHLADKIEEYLKINDNFGANIVISDERDRLLETGGGIKKAAGYLSGAEPFLIYNSDIITDLNLADLYSAHVRSNALVSLAVRKRASGRCFLFDNDMRLCGWSNLKTGEERIARQADLLMPLAFSGIHVMNTEALKMLPEIDRFTLVDFYLQIAADHYIAAFEHSNTHWVDIGKPETLEEVKNFDLLNYL